ncbi:VOC family protein [Parapedobacter sp. GCM10030251]|uniref:VOC family protein n=1 Tax=Parapedobacter sp. GCM10030251 TaxID=3273419 RepID=UPI00360F920A
MNILSLSVSLTVNNVKASADFLIKHFGFKEKIEAEGFASLIHETSGINIIYMQTGIEVLPEFLRNIPVAGTLLAFVTTNLEAEEERLRSAGVSITLPLQTEEWGEKLFMVTDPNGVVIEVVEWITTGEDNW